MNQVPFPSIENLSDVLPHIEGREEFIVSRKDEYTIVCYVVGLQSTFELDESDLVGSMIRRECRGLAFSNSTGELISRPYHKFFNVGEREETHLQNLDVSVPHVILEKLDGSMIRPIYLEGEKRWRLGTKMGVTEVAMNAEAWIADKVRFLNLIEECRLINFTPIFEWCSRQNRIVVDYPEEGLILTALRSNRSGFYLCHADMMAFALANNLRPNEVVKIIQSGSINQQSLEQIKAWDDGEGVVIRFEGPHAANGHMVKVKADNYVLLHKSKDAISQEKNVIDVIVNDKVDDLLPILSDKDRETLISFQEKFWMMVDVVAEFLENEYNEGRHISDQKTFAREFVSSCPKKFHGFLYHAHKGGDIKNLLIKKISSSLSSRTKVNEARWMWGGLVWNEAN